MNSAMPWPGPTDAEVAEHDRAREAADQAFIAANRHSELVAKKVAELRILEDARARILAEKVTDTNFASSFLTRTQLLDLPTPEPLIARVLPRHAYAILRGRDQTLKSFVAIDWACCLATGKPWQEHAVPDPVRVLYIAGEGAHGLSSRIDAWEYAWGRTVPDDMLTVRTTAVNMHTPGPAFEHLLETVRAGNYGLVVVDTLRRVSGAADGNSSEMGAVIDNLDRIKRATAGGTVLAVAHTDKGDNDTRGYSGIEDDADVVWSAKREEDRLTLALAKMKDGVDGTAVHLTATRTLNSLTLAGTDGPAKVNTTENQLKILDTVRELFPDGARGTELRDTAGIAKSSYYRALGDLTKAGHLVNTGTKRMPFYELPALLDTTTEDPETAPTDDVDDTLPDPTEDTPQ